MISPSSTYNRAVRGGWKVNPTWPAFDEIRGEVNGVKVKLPIL